MPSIFVAIVHGQAQCKVFFIVCIVGCGVQWIQLKSNVHKNPSFLFRPKPARSSVLLAFAMILYFLLIWIQFEFCITKWFSDDTKHREKRTNSSHDVITAVKWKSYRNNGEKFYQRKTTYTRWPASRLRKLYYWFHAQYFHSWKKEKKNNNWTRTFPRNRYAFWKYNKTHVFDVVDWHVCRINISHDIPSTVNFMPM